MVTEGGTASMRTNSLMAEGTVLIQRTWDRAGNSAKARASGARITRPPQAKGRNSSNTERSKLTEVAASMPDRSSGRKTPRAQRSSSTALACSMATPLGRPVEPEV